MNLNKSVKLIAIILINILLIAIMCSAVSAAGSKKHTLAQILDSSQFNKSVDLNNNSIIDMANHTKIFIYLFNETYLNPTSTLNGVNKTLDRHQGLTMNGLCVIRHNADSKYGAGKWMACPTGYYMAAITDDEEDNQDLLCCAITSSLSRDMPSYSYIQGGDVSISSSGNPWGSVAILAGAAALGAYVGLMVGGPMGAAVGGALGFLIGSAGQIIMGDSPVTTLLVNGSAAAIGAYIGLIVGGPAGAALGGALGFVIAGALRLFGL